MGKITPIARNSRSLGVMHVVVGFQNIRWDKKENNLWFQHMKHIYLGNPDFYLPTYGRYLPTYLPTFQKIPLNGLTHGCPLLPDIFSYSTDKFCSEVHLQANKELA